MKRYAVAVLSFFDNDNKVFLVQAENPVFAVHAALLEFNTEEASKQDHIDWWEDRGKGLELQQLLDDLINQELSVSEPVEII